MPSINSTSNVNSFLNSYGISNKGVGGLMSGLDTDSLVEALTSGTKNKIDKQNQQKTLLTWQRDAYRSVADLLTSFQSKWVDTQKSGSSLISNASFFNNFKGNSSSTKVTLASDTYGVGDVKIDKILQLASAETYTTKNVTDSLSGTDNISTMFANRASFDGQSIKLSVNGLEKTIDLSSLKNATSEDDLKTQLQGLLNTFGTKSELDASGNLTGNRVGIVQAVFDASGNFKLEATNKNLTVVDGAAIGVASNTSNFVDLSQSVNDYFKKIDPNFTTSDTYTMKLNGKEFSVKGDTSLSSFMISLNNSQTGVKINYDSVAGTFKFNNATTGAGQNMTFEDVSGGFLEAFTGGPITNGIPTGMTRTEGNDAEIVVNGQVLTQSTNIFDVGGVKFEVNDTELKETITISSRTDSKALMDKISSFVDDYNALISAITNLVKEENEDGYTPLTDAQKAAMTTEEIKTWENEAKKGLLRNDPYLQKILDDLRMTVNKKVGAAGLSLADIGITTASFVDSSGNYSSAKAGQLTINQDRLRDAIENNPDSIRVLFTNYNDEKDLGIAASINNIIKTATNKSSIRENRGTLVYLAGTKDLTGDNTSVLGDKISSIDRYVSSLRSRMQMEYNRYWKKFSALESSVSRMNSQSSWLANNAG